ncbi:hypothetical protein SNR37_003145 [Agarivorans aestuarii]|uniref:Antitoxin Xre/MbcA/ParS-like toxin-binding domain-containing protein n=1 Tax=Agarivorans aestuarii TaxID=1563703 RepID=A0ABU7G2Z6_9ALTE|nr:hypothetical protein [Agarivorans aestuarii]MEE1673718.1 hypothetical protein [Agarivorans aestuarii]
MNTLLLSDSEVETLLYLVRTEMQGICGDLGYQELSRIRDKLEGLKANTQEARAKDQTSSASEKQKKKGAGSDFFDSLDNQSIGALMLSLPDFYARVMAVFKTEEAARGWLLSRMQALDGRAPLEAYKDEPALVEEILRKVDKGELF